MKKTIAAAALIVCTAALGFAGDAQTAPAGRHAGHHQRAARLGAKLNLSQTQRDQMKAIRQRSRDANQQLFTDFRSKRQELRQLRQAGDPRAEEVKAQLMSMRDQVRAAKQASRQEMLQVLTPEQRQQLEQLRAARRANRG